MLTVILANGLRLSQVSVESAESGAGHRRLLVSRFRELVERVFRENWALADYASPSEFRSRSSGEPRFN